MRILLLNPGLPFPLTNGENVRTFSLFSHISRLHRVTAVALNRQDTASSPGLEQISQFCENYYQIQPEKIVWPAFFSRTTPPCFAEFRSRRLRKTISTLLEKENFDLIHCGHVAMMMALPKNPGIPVILQQDTAHLPTMLAQIGARQAEAIMQDRAELFRVRSTLAALWRQADAIIVPIEHVRAAIVSCVSETNIFTVPHGVDSHYFSHRGEDESEKTLVLPGAFDRPANASAARYFVSSIWPKIQAKDSAARLFIVGRKPPAELQQFNNFRNVFVTGEVLDIRPFIAGGTVIVFPQQIEGNSAGIKLLEAMALSRAVVATPEAAAGLQIMHGKHYLEGRTTEHFAECVLQLLNDEELRKELGGKAREYVAHQHRWEKVAGELLMVYQRLGVNAGHDDAISLPVREVSTTEISPEKLSVYSPPPSEAGEEIRVTPGDPPETESDERLPQ